MGVGGFFPGRASRGFSQIFLQGEGKSSEIWFLPLKIKKTTFFANNFKIQGVAKALPNNAHYPNAKQS